VSGEAEVSEEGVRVRGRHEVGDVTVAEGEVGVSADGFDASGSLFGIEAEVDVDYRDGSLELRTPAGTAQGSADEDLEALEDVGDAASEAVEEVGEVVEDVVDDVIDVVDEFFGSDEDDEEEDDDETWVDEVTDMLGGLF